ncbi:hypothetical protein ASZ90_010868 [hydrocarbon metagenome]|uniref:Uncharacterized protein n=1 Tax=hydrocarbon metagenome TaxID=938273 RepID=A0A0W8FEU5_9ZZZZ
MTLENDLRQVPGIETEKRVAACLLYLSVLLFHTHRFS